MTSSIAMTARLAAEAAAHLLRPDGNEDLCFGLWRPSSGRMRATAIIDRVLLPRDGDRLLHGNVAFTSQYFERALAEARNEGTGLALMHSHPPFARGWQALSEDDHRAEAGIAGAIAASTELPLVGMTIAGGDGRWSGRSWHRHSAREYEPRYCDTVRIVGDGLRVDYDDSQRPRPASPLRLKRTMTAWGEDAHADLARLRIGLLGAGSVGSIVGEGLARMGIERIVILDFDSLGEINLDRTLGAYESDIGTAKAELALRTVRASATAKTLYAEAHEHSVCEDAGYRAALDCDVLFSCVDRPWPRSVINFIAYAHLIPVIDGGIHVSRLRSGRMRGADWKAHTVGPDHRCLQCLGQYDPGLVQAEREGHLDDPRYIESLPTDHPVRANENVFPFSLGAASLELMQLVSLVIGPAGIHNFGAQTYHASTGTIDIDVDGCDASCPYSGLVGRGDHGPHPGTGLHRAADRARAEREQARSKI